MNADKVLALAKQAANSFKTYAMEVTEYDFTDDSIQEFAALLQREMEAENAEQPALQVWKNKETGKHLFEWLIAPDKFSDGAKFYAIDRARSANDKG